jgi:SAM-dependent methyltransferase
MASLRSSERSMHDTINAGLNRLQDSVPRLQTLIEQGGDRLRTVESVVEGLEQVMVSSAPAPAASVAPDRPQRVLPARDYSYFALENRFRGNSADIRRHLAFYPEFFKDAPGPVLEIGPGRGELLELLKERKLPAFGADSDAAMVEVCRDKGLDVRPVDGLACLRSLNDGSLGGVVAIQVVEHLAHADLTELIRLCWRKVASGGRVVFETVNPRSLLALSSNFFRDPTHVWPCHPDTLRYAMTLAGFRDVDLHWLSPVQNEAQLRRIKVEEYMTPRWAYTLECLNRNIDQLNELLYGYQNYCVAAVAP